MDREDRKQRVRSVTPGTSISGIAAVILIVLFFTPWFSACGIQFSGADLAGGMDGESAPWLFGIPLVGLAVVVIALRNLNQPLKHITRWARYVLILAAYPLLCLIALYAQFLASSDDAMFDVRALIEFEFGFYGTLLATIAMAIGAALDWAGQGEALSIPSWKPIESSHAAEPSASRPPPREKGRRPRAWLQGQAGGFADKAVELTQDITRIGSGQGCEVRLRDPSVAAVHAVVCYARGRYYLQDQGTATGVLLNGEYLEASVLEDGDLIGVGRTLLRFREL